MRKKLESLSKEELVKIANHYSIFNAEKMNKEELIRHILIHNGDEKSLKEIQRSDDRQIRQTIKNKLSWRQIAFHIMFVALILMLFATTVDQLITRLYFYPKMSNSLNRNNVYGLFLTIASSAWSIYVYWYWYKSKRLNPFLLFSVFMSIGWSIYKFINDYDAIRFYNNLPEELRNISSLRIYKSFTIYYWTMLSLISFFAVVSFSMFIIRSF